MNTPAPAQHDPVFSFDESSMSEVRHALKREGALVESFLAGALREKELPEGLLEAMEYSLLGGGKRIRPVLCLLTARLFGTESDRILPFAAALECIHTYSLIHDDLPAMDDDDLRRGRPSNHKRFDEATAILAGDGLLTDAFGLMCSVAEKGGLPPERILRAIALVAEAAGSPGMVGGQFLDMQYTGRLGVRLDELAYMHAMKTGALLRAACLGGAILAGAQAEDLRAVAAYGSALGSAFQIADDILDETGSEKELGKPVGSDAAQNKNTYPSLLGIDESRALARERAREAMAALQPYRGDTAFLLKGLAAYVVNRLC